MKRSLSILLLVALLMSAVSCSESGQTETDPEASNTPQGSETQLAAEGTEIAAESEEDKILPDIPDTTYDGQALRFLSREDTDTVVRFYSEIAADEINGEIMNDSIFERTLRLEDTWKIDIIDDRQDDVQGVYQRSYQASEQNWDVIVTGFNSANSMAAAGYTADLTDVEYIDLEKPWWDSSMADSMRIYGKLYAAIGAINTWTDSMTQSVVFNKEMAVSFGVDPYTMVRENQWTLDQFSAILEQVSSDIDGNGVIDENDRFGAIGENADFSAFMLASDIILVSKDEDGNPAINIPEKFYDAADKICRIISSDCYMSADDYKSKFSDPWTDGIRVNFRKGNSLFSVGFVQDLLIFRDLDTDIGIVPMPKYDEEQEKYRHSINYYWGSAMFLPRNSSTLPFTGHMLEAMNADSLYSTSAAYYDVVLKGKAMRDRDSCEMLDIIRTTRTVDPESAYAFLGIQSIYASMVQSKSTDTLASKIKSSQRRAQRLINEFYEKYQ